jgi:hypothetical protein
MLANIGKGVNRHKGFCIGGKSRTSSFEAQRA